MALCISGDILCKKLFQSCNSVVQESKSSEIRSKPYLPHLAMLFCSNHFIFLGFSDYKTQTDAVTSSTLIMRIGQGTGGKPPRAMEAALQYPPPCEEQQTTLSGHGQTQTAITPSQIHTPTFFLCVMRKEFARFCLLALNLPSFCLDPDQCWDFSGKPLYPGEFACLK